ncbi:MAG: glucose-6-phosphate dehydrogenase, partial [Acidimicrobiia bacterium]|nr:glucose-6-phosphate dehydrogenase [Acidimicrobiia bacterium]
MTETVTQAQSGAEQVVDAATAAVATVGQQHVHESCDALVLFGASGDLAKKLVIPSLYRLVEDGRLDIPVIGVALTEWDDEGMRDYAEDSLRNHGLDLKGDKTWRNMRRHLHFVCGNYADDKTFEALAAKLADLKSSFPLFYLAIPPNFFGQVVEQLAKHGLAKKCRVVVEKPFGRDLAS